MTARVRVLFIVCLTASALAVRGDVINGCVDKKGDDKITYVKWIGQAAAPR